MKWATIVTGVMGLGMFSMSAFPEQTEQNRFVVENETDQTIYLECDGNSHSVGPGLTSSEITCSGSLDLKGFSSGGSSEGTIQHGFRGCEDDVQEATVSVETSTVAYSSETGEAAYGSTFLIGYRCTATA